MTNSIRKVFLALCLSVIATSTVMLLMGAWNIGVSGDEYIDILSFRGWGWAADPATPHFGVYGLSAQLMNHATAVLLGAEPIGQVVFSPEAFAARHLATAMLGITAAAASGAITFVMTRSKAIGVWVAAVVCVIQPFLGHSFFNAKDIPVATGYTLTTLALVLALQEIGTGRRTFRRWVWVVLSLIAGLWLAVGTRYVFAIPILLSILFTVVCISFLPTMHGGRSRTKSSAIYALSVGTAGGFAALFLSNPCLVSVPSKCENPWQIFSRLLAGSIDIQFTAPTLILGELVSPIDPPFWVLPVVLLAGLPIFVVLLAVLGAIFGPENLRLKSDGRETYVNRSKLVTGIMVLLLVLQCGLVPLITILSRQEVYDMQRHHLYVYPAAASLAGVGLALLLNRTYFPARADVILRNTVAVIAVGVLWFPLADGLRLWPYNYVYVNPLASIQGYGNMWETDYWGTSLRESLRYVPKDEPFEVVGFFWIVRPFMAQRGDKAVDVEAGPDEIFVIQTNRPGLGWSGLPDQCKIVKRITRSLRGKEIPISEVGICPKSLETGAASFEDIVNHNP